jgi:hypothetical protein
MELIKNCLDWITPEFMEFIKTNNGDTVPVWQPDRWKGHPMLDEAREKTRPGYATTGHTFQQFNPQSADMAKFNLTLPTIPGDERRQYWWIIKLLPGQMQPIHFDPHLITTPNPQRYTMFLEDWKPGHIFVYDDKYISNYKSGDLYRWYDPMMIHGVVNIGFEPRYTLQITTYD